METRKCCKSISVMLALILALTLCSQPVFAEDAALTKGSTFTQDGLTYKIVSVEGEEGHVKVIGADTTATSVEIPGTVEEGGLTWAVTAISGCAFKDCTLLTKVTTGENIRSIGKKAFSGCAELTELDLSSSTELKKIGKDVLKDDPQVVVSVPDAKDPSYYAKKLGVDASRIVPAAKKTQEEPAETAVTEKLTEKADPQTEKETAESDDSKDSKAKKTTEQSAPSALKESDSQETPDAKDPKEETAKQETASENAGQTQKDTKPAESTPDTPSEDLSSALNETVSNTERKTFQAGTPKKADTKQTSGADAAKETETPKETGSQEPSRVTEAAEQKEETKAPSQQETSSKEEAKAPQPETVIPEEHSYEFLTAAAPEGTKTPFHAPAQGEENQTREKENASCAAGHHFFIELSREESTCEKTGYIIWKCANCEVTKTELLPKKEHTWTVKETAATCSSTGYREQICTVCGAVAHWKMLPMVAHTPGELETKEATCTENGYRKQTCTVCGAVLLNETIPAKGHSLYLKSSVEATCIDEGSETWACYDCGEEMTKIVPPLPTHHNWVLDADGKHKHCSICGAEAPEDES